MTNISTAHTALLSFCKGQPGIAIGTELIQYFIKTSINKANSSGHGGTPIRFPSTNGWQNLPVAFTMNLNPNSFAVKFDPLMGPSGSTAVPRLKMTDLEVTLGIYVHDVLFSTHVVRYPTILSTFTTKNKRLALARDLVQGTWDGKPGDANELWKTMAKLPDGRVFTPDLQDDWNVQERAYLEIAEDAIATSFTETLPIPDVLGMVQAFSFTGPLSMTTTADVLMLTGTAEWKYECPRRPAVAVPPDQSVVPSSAITTPAAALAAAPPLAAETDDPYPHDHQYPKMEEVERSYTADLFVHLPIVFMQHRFDGIVKPSITFSDSGSFAIIEWHYDAAISPMPGGTLQISLNQIWPTEFEVSCPLRAFGQAGAGVEIACIHYDVVGIGFSGDVNPFQAFFEIGLDSTAEDLYFESHLGTVTPVNFSFNHFPSLRFPIDQIADAILKEVASAIIRAQSGQILNVTRFSVANFGLFKGFGPLSKTLASQSDTPLTATTYGVTFQKQ